MIYIRDFEAVQKTHSHVLSGVKTLIIHSCSFFKQYLLLWTTTKVVSKNNILYYIHFEITGYPCNLIGSQQCDLFLNRTIFALNRICSKSRHSCSKSNHFCFKSHHFCSIYCIISVSNTKWDVKAFLFRLFNKPATRSIKY